MSQAYYKSGNQRHKSWYITESNAPESNFEKLKAIWLAKKNLAFYGKQMFITVCNNFSNTCTIHFFIINSRLQVSASLGHHQGVTDTKECRLKCVSMNKILEFYSYLRILIYTLWYLWRPDDGLVRPKHVGESI
jgi:hypothetical protein